MTKLNDSWDGKQKGDFIIIEGCAFRLSDIQCVLHVDGEYPYEVTFRGGNSVLIDEGTGEALMEIL